NRSSSLHIEGMPNQSGNMKWMLFLNPATTNLGNDRAGNARIACPGAVLDYNPWLVSFGSMRASLLNGFLPLIPIPIWWRNTSPTPAQYMLLGFAPDIYLIQMANFNPGDEFTIGADTYKVFPM